MLCPQMRLLLLLVAVALVVSARPSAHVRPSPLRRVVFSGEKKVALKPAAAVKSSAAEVREAAAAYGTRPSPLRRAVFGRSSSRLRDLVMMDVDPSAWDGAPVSATASKKVALEAAAVEVREAASAFGGDTAKFAERWAAKLARSGTLASSSDFQLLEECLVSEGSPECLRLEEGIKKMTALAGSEWDGTNS